jgi:hypothetical protein
MTDSQLCTYNPSGGFWESEDHGSLARAALSKGLIKLGSKQSLVIYTRSAKGGVSWLLVKMHK